VNLTVHKGTTDQKKKKKNRGRAALSKRGKGKNEKQGTGGGWLLFFGGKGGDYRAVQQGTVLEQPFPSVGHREGTVRESTGATAEPQTGRPTQLMAC